MTKLQIAILRMYRPETYAISLPQNEASRLVKRGYLKKVPSVWGDTPNYAITHSGKAAVC